MIILLQVTGEPMPESKWFLAKKEVKSSGDMKVQHSDYNTKINCKAATRADSGRYTITAENVNGKDLAEVEVIVLSAPSPPGGPLKVCINCSASMNLTISFSSR